MAAYTKPPKFPGLDKLPPGLAKAIEFLFPQEPDISTAIPGTAVSGPPLQLLKALRPLAGSINRGTEVARDLPKIIPEAPPQPHVKALLDLLETAKPSIRKAEPLLERFGSRRPFETSIQSRDFFSVSPKMRLQHTPLMEEMLTRYRKFDEIQKAASKGYGRHAKGPLPSATERRPLLGRWQNQAKRTSAQRRTIAANTKK